MHYLFNEFGHYAGTSEIATPNSTTVAPPDAATQEWCWNHVEWISVPLGHGAAAISASGAMSGSPQSVYQAQTPVQFYNCFTVGEMIAIKGSTDPFVKEFYARYLVALQTNEPINPNLISVQEGLAYLTEADQQPAVTPAAPYLEKSRIPQILTGVPQ